MLFVYDNSVCRKCFDLVFHSNQKLRKILKRLAWKRNGNYFHAGENPPYLLLSHVASITSSPEDHQLSLEAVLLLKSMGATRFSRVRLMRKGETRLKRKRSDPCRKSHGDPSAFAANLLSSTRHLRPPVGV